MARRRAGQPGAVVRIPMPELPDGLGIVSHVHPEWGPLLRVFGRRLGPSGDEAWRDILREAPVLTCFVQVGYFLRKRLFEEIAIVEVPDHLKPFPLFRSAGLPDPITRQESLWLWDGERSWRVEERAEELRSLPSMMALTLSALVAYLERGWGDLDSDLGFDYSVDQSRRPSSASVFSKYRFE